MTLSLAGPLLLVGAGKMGGALLEGWLRQGLDPAAIFIRDPAPPPEVLALATRHDIVVAAAPDLPALPSVVVVAVKPALIDKLMPELAPLMGKGSIVLSIAAGKTLATLAGNLPSGTAVVRAMPNVAASVGRSMTVACANSAVTRDQALECTMLLEAIGDVMWIDDESLLDAVTAVSGSGPAYVFLLAECMAEAGRAAGLDAELARRLARATVEGAGELLRRSDLSPQELREKVTSPQGTTAAALQILMGKDGIQDLLTCAVAAATKRSRELSS
jgi:pyrroline-5-carboxylate reductase